MCRFVAVLSSEDINLREYFNFLKKQALEGKRAPHRDGFGYWILSKNGEHYYRTTLPAWNFKGALPKGHVAFFHARKRGKTGAPVEIDNVHPFIRRGSVFMHNGTLHIHKHPRAVGDTDTESFFLTLLDHGIEEGLKSIVENEEFTSLNFVMYRGEDLYIFRLAIKAESYYSIFIKENSSEIVISTEEMGAGFRKMRNGEMLIISKDLKVDSYCIFPDMCH